MNTHTVLMWPTEAEEQLFRTRVRALERAKVRARDPEFRALWEQKKNELIRNERTRLVSK